MLIDQCFIQPSSKRITPAAVGDENRDPDPEITQRKRDFGMHNSK